LGVNYSVDTLEKRSGNKGLLQEKLGFPQDEFPLIAMVTRMDVQKGVDLALSALKSLKQMNFRAVILGTGDPKLEQAATDIQTLFPEKIRVETRYDAGFARQIYAGADLLLMPSRYEPCGLSQMIAMRYGCVPVVRAVGGLRDTVLNGKTGFVFEKAHHLSLAGAIRSALKVFADREKWTGIQRSGMIQDYSWESSARRYLEVYKGLVKP
jgi:starch synthase